MTDPRDIALQASCSALAVPKFTALPDMAMGQRVLVAGDGVFLQVKTAWLDCILPLASLGIRLPYGHVSPSIRCAFGKVPSVLLREFVDWARASLPDEVAGGLVYSSATGKLRLARYESAWKSPHGVAYRLPPLPPDETVAVDLHSHGSAAAFFSATDDADDLGIKIAGVFGEVDQPDPTCRFRLVVGRVKLDLPSPALASPRI